MMIGFSQNGGFKKTLRFLERCVKSNPNTILKKYAEKGLLALISNTPIDSGKTSSSWGYEIQSTGSSHAITWTNSNVINGSNIAVLIQYGHGTNNGGYVSGVDYINPALRGLFEEIAKDVWREIVK